MARSIVVVAIFMLLPGFPPVWAQEAEKTGDAPPSKIVGGSEIPGTGTGVRREQKTKTPEIEGEPRAADKLAPVEQMTPPPEHDPNPTTLDEENKP